MSVTETSPEETAEEAPEPAPPPPSPSIGSGASGNDHKVLGTAFFGVALLFLIAGGVLALIMRGQLSSPDATLVTERGYRTLFTFHGTFLVFLFLLPAWVGIATAVVPLQIGAARLAFPRLQALAFWMTVAGGGLVATTPFIRGARRIISSWTLSRPIPEGAAFGGKAIEFLELGLVLVLAASVLAMVNLMTTIVRMRPPGLTSRRLPLFSWTVLVSGMVLLLAAPVLIAGLVMLYVDHHYGADLFSGWTSSRGGSPLLWPRMFWFGAYPLLWAFVIFALGVASEIIPVFARRPIADRFKAMGALGAVGVLAFFGWGSELQNFPRSRLFFAAGALAVLAPVAAVILNWLLTLRKAGKEQGTHVVREGLLQAPMLHVLGLVSVLAAGLAAGAVSAAGAGSKLHGNYWQVGQQHLLYFAPATIALVAAAHYWGPKLWGRHLSSGLGKLEVLLLTGGAHLAFLPALVLGLQDMPVQTATYTSDDPWQPANLAMTAGAAVLTLGVLVFALNLLVTIVLRRGRPAAADPWDGHTLEWTAPSPPPLHNFDRLPEIRSATPAIDARSRPQLEVEA
jgi:heme/copper-type cytochrome/quinol oxidase subunit 1